MSKLQNVLKSFDTIDNYISVLRIDYGLSCSQIEEELSSFLPSNWSEDDNEITFIQGVFNE